MKLRKTGAVMRQDAVDAAYRQDDNTGAPPVAQQTVVLIKLDGKDYVQGSAAHVAALELKLDAADVKAKAAEAELGAVKAKLDAVPAQPDVSALVQDELAFRDSMRALVGKDYKFDGKSRLQVRLDAVGADVAAKVQALPEGQREGYLQCAIDSKVAAADRPTHAPTAPVKQDASTEPKKYNPFDAYKTAFAEARK